MLILRPTDQYFDNLDESQFLLMNFFLVKWKKLDPVKYARVFFRKIPPT